MQHTDIAEKSALTIEDFAELHSISRGYVYKLINQGRGPRLMKVGRRTLISRESAAEWRRAMEQPRAGAA